MPTPRALLGMTLGALVATMGALFLGEYEFDELLPIMSGALLGLIVAEVVVSVGRLRNLAIGLMTATWSATAVVLAGVLDANETGPIKAGAYLSAALAAVAAFARANQWRRKKTETVDEEADTAEESPTPQPRRSTERPSSPRPTPAPRRQPSPRPKPVQGSPAPRRRPQPERRPDPQRQPATRRRPQPERRPQPSPRPEAQRQSPQRQRPSEGRPASRRPVVDDEWAPTRITVNARKQPRNSRDR